MVMVSLNNGVERVGGVEKKGVMAKLRSEVEKGLARCICCDKIGDEHFVFLFELHSDCKVEI